MSQESTRKRDRARNLLGIRKNSPNPASARSRNSGASPHATASTILLPPQTLLSPRSGQSISDGALLALSPREREVIEAQQSVGPREIHAIVEAAYAAALGQRQACDDKRWQWNFRGRTVVLRDEADKVLAWLDRFKSVGDVVANVDPIHVGLPWAGIRMILEMGNSDSHQRAALLTGMSMALCMANRLHVYVLYFQRLPPSLAKDNFENALVKLYTQELRFLATAIETFQKSTATRIWQALWQTSTLEEFESQSDKLGSRAEIEASNCDREISARRWEGAKQWKSDLEQALQRLDDIQGVGSAVADLQIKVDLTKLVTAEGAVYNSHADADSAWCLEGTRIQLLDQIAAWTTDPVSKCIFWLCGMAGTGKSTISRTLSHTLDKERRLGASFFFKRGERKRSNASFFFPTIATQLADMLPGLKPLIAQALDSDSQLCERNLQEQFEKLVSQPLRDVTQVQASARLIIVIDALDECERSTDIRTILMLLARLESIVTFELRIFVTSREELPIQLGFRTISGDLHQDIKLEEVQATTIKHDIDTYFRHRLEEIKQEDSVIHMYDPLPADWPGEHNFSMLVDLAVPLFIAAFTICRYISEKDSQTRLQTILQQGAQTLVGLDEIYLPILDQVVLGYDAQSRDEAVDDFRQLVGPIILLADPLPIPALSTLLSIPLRQIFDRLRHLHSVLNVPADVDTPVRLLHLSFRDVLVDPRMKEKNRFWIDEIQFHRKLAADCLRRLTTLGTLTQDMCNLDEPGIARMNVSKAHVASCIAPDVAYACCYWAWHLVRGKGQLHDGDQVHMFLLKHFLHWLEALSWLGRLSEAIKYVCDLRQLFNVNTGARLLAFLDDANRFLLRNRYIIDLAPLQTYSSALIFTPEQSLVRRQFEHDRPKWLVRLPQVPLAWSPEILNLEGHDGPVNAVSFSPDGQVVASASNDETVRLWNASTGEETQKLVGHDNSVSAVAFSPDGQVVASASDDKTVRLWNISTGEETQKLVGHDNWVSAVAFSPDGQVVASASDDKTVRLWNASTGEETQKLVGHDDWVRAVAFSPDGQVVASASHDETVRLWNASTGEETQKLVGHDDWVRAVAFSPDGQVVASASHDETVRLWNASTGEETQKLVGHDNWVSAVAFSPDGQVVASVSGDKTVRLWNASTGEETQKLVGHDNSG